MSRAINKLSAVQIKTLKGRGLYADGGNLCFQISESGTKSWIFRFKRNKKPRSMGLGPYSDVTLAKAREAAQECREIVRGGRDPIEERKAARQAQYAEVVKTMTFKECADQYIKDHSVSWTVKHTNQWTSTLQTYAYPVFGNLQVNEVDTNLVMKVLRPIWHTKSETAGRVRGRIESVLDWAKASKLREGENPAMLKGNLDQLLPALSKVQKVKHHPALYYEEVGAFMERLRKQNGISAMGLELTILTACRTSESLKAKWEEFDFDKKLWTIPAERMKMGREHRVPLSHAAIEVLRKLQAVRQNDYVLPGMRGNSPLSNMAFLKLLQRMDRKDITVHGFRSTFKDWASERTAYPNEVSEMALAHAVGDKVEAAYRRGDLLEKRKRIMDDWAEYCSTLGNESKDNVVEMRR